MVQHFDLEQLGGSYQILGDLSNRFTGRRVPGRVVMLCGVPIYVQLAELEATAERAIKLREA